MWEIVGWVGTALVVVSMLQTRITRLRLVNLLGSTVTVVYAAAIQSWPVLALNVLLALIQIWNLWKLWHTRHDPDEYRAVAVDPGSEIVAHVIRQHEDLVPADVPADVGFLVLHGDTLAGVVLARVQQDVAVLDVDYVIPAYRDLTPGEFVFHRSGVWAMLGVRAVRSSAGGDAYYGRIGFARVDGGWELSIG